MDDDAKKLLLEIIDENQKKANKARLDAIRQRDTLERHSPQPQYYLGHDRESGKSILGANDGSMRRVANVGNVQAPLGSLSRVGADTFDPGISRRPSIERRSRAEGDIKVCVSVLNQENANIREYWLGGDRKTAIKIYEVSLAAETVVSADFESTGVTKSDWIFALKTKQLGTAVDVPRKLLVIYGDGERWESDWNPRYHFLEYQGGGFFSGNAIISDITTIGNILNPEQTTTTGNFDAPSNGIISGGVAGIVEWAYPIVYLANTSATGAQQVVSRTGSGVAVSDQTWLAYFDFNLSGSYNSQFIDTRAWTTIPGGDASYQSVVAAGAAVCDGPGPSSQISWGRATQSETLDRSQILTQTNYFLKWFEGNYSEATGIRERSVVTDNNFSKIDYTGESWTLSAVCTDFGGTIGRRYVLGASERTQPPANSSSSNNSTITRLSVNYPIPILPNFSSPESNNYQESIINGVTTTINEFQISRVIQVFGKEPKGYYYYSDHLNNLTIYRITDGVNETAIASADQTTGDLTWRIAGNALERYRVDGTAFTQNDWLTKTIRPAIKQYKTDALGNTETEEFATGKMLPLKLGRPKEQINVIAARWWPKN